MEILGTKTTVKKSSEDLFNFLLQLRNYEQLMPESTEKFEIDGESFVFGLKGMPEIRLVIKEKLENTLIVLGAASSKMPFTLQIPIERISDNLSEVTLKFSGEFNPMVRMMVKKPLTNFIEALTGNLEKI
jgi:hypothetical protein